MSPKVSIVKQQHGSPVPGNNYNHNFKAEDTIALLRKNESERVIDAVDGNSYYQGSSNTSNSATFERMVTKSLDYLPGQDSFKNLVFKGSVNRSVLPTNKYSPIRKKSAFHGSLNEI